jgi:hypothetical protein
MMQAANFLGPVVRLNLERYTVGGLLEFPVTSHLFRVTQEYPAIFNNHFTTLDWTTSYM